jgi:hypothetical protein
MGCASWMRVDVNCFFGLGAEMADNARKIKEIQENDAETFRKWDNRRALSMWTGAKMRL